MIKSAHIFPAWDKINSEYTNPARGILRFLTFASKSSVGPSFIATLWKRGPQNKYNKKGTDFFVTESGFRFWTSLRNHTNTKKAPFREGLKYASPAYQHSCKLIFCDWAEKKIANRALLSKSRKKAILLRGLTSQVTGKSAVVAVRLTNTLYVNITQLLIQNDFDVTSIFWPEVPNTHGSP